MSIPNPRIAVLPRPAHLQLVHVQSRQLLRGHVRLRRQAAERLRHLLHRNAPPRGAGRVACASRRPLGPVRLPLPLGALEQQPQQEPRPTIVLDLRRGPHTHVRMVLQCN